jgi:predicted RNA-binding Zn ribbon-like protein
MGIASSITSSEFRFNSGALSLDLAATVRRRASEPYDALAEPGAVARWLKEARITAAILRLSRDEEAAVLALREAIWSAAAAMTDRSRIPRAAITTINRAAAHPLAVPYLAATGRRAFLTDDPFSAAISVIARDAIEILAGARRIKACAQPNCRMLFVDASPTGRRRWCSMDRCGSRAKGAVFRSRKERKHER